MERGKGEEGETTISSHFHDGKGERENAWTGTSYSYNFPEKKGKKKEAGYGRF